MAKSAPSILFISHDSGRTGAPIGLLAFMQWLRAHTNFTLGTILRSPGPLENSFRELGPTLTLGTSFLARSRLGRKVRQRLPRSVQNESAKIRKFFTAGAYDLIYSNTITNGAVLEMLAPFGVPVLTHVHELEYWINRTGSENLQRVIAHTTAYVAVAQAVRDNLVHRHQIPAEKIAVIYEHIRELPVVPSAEAKIAARRNFGIPDGALVVGGCGAEHWRKGRDLIPQLLISLRRQRASREIHFVWVGRPGNPEEELALRYDLKSAGVATLFHQTGEVANPFELFPAIDVFALLSRDDPYPLACLEVAALETPVVCFAGAGGMPEFCHDGCGFVAPYLDLDVMARDIVNLAANPELSRASGRLARSKVARENLLEATAPQLRLEIERLIQTRSGKLQRKS